MNKENSFKKPMKIIPFPFSPWGVFVFSHSVKTLLVNFSRSERRNTFDYIHFNAAKLTVDCQCVCAKSVVVDCLFISGGRFKGGPIKSVILQSEFLAGWKMILMRWKTIIKSEGYTELCHM